MNTEPFDQLLSQVRACRLCADRMDHEPRPVLRGRPGARLLIASQAPGMRVFQTGLPFNDPSGDRLRGWLGIDRETFYDESRVAIVPMGLCYPGTNPKGGDYPPRPECAPAWRKRLLAALPNVELTLVIGSYAIDWHLGERAAATMTETVSRFRDYLPSVFPLPHPSWRNNAWLSRNPWFASDALPLLRERVAALL